MVRRPDPFSASSISSTSKAAGRDTRNRASLMSETSAASRRPAGELPPLEAFRGVLFHASFSGV